MNAQIEKKINQPEDFCIWVYLYLLLLEYHSFLEYQKFLYLP